MLERRCVKLSRHEVEECETTLDLRLLIESRAFGSVLALGLSYVMVEDGDNYIVDAQADTGLLFKSIERTQTVVVDKEAKDLDYLTPPRILEPLQDYYVGGIPLDPATTQDNPTGAKKFFTPAIDGLAQPWLESVYVNPPYGKQMKPWLQKIGREARKGVEILALLPVVRTEQSYFQDVIAQAHAVCLVRKRVSFIRPSTGKTAKGNPHASALWGFNVQRERFHAAFSPLGLVLMLTVPISQTQVTEPPTLPQTKGVLQGDGRTITRTVVGLSDSEIEALGLPVRKVQ